MALVAATAIVYAPVRHHEFVNLDDPQYVTGNPWVARGLSGPGLRWAFTTGHAGNWHPLTWLSHMLDVQLFGLSPGAHHLTSLALHLANTVLLLALLHRTTGALGRSSLVAALFALHPVHVESVAWVAERKDVLSTVFFLLTLHAYVSYARFPRARRYAVVLALFALGLMAKPMLVTLPLVLLLLDYWPLGRLSSPAEARRRVLEKLPLMAMAAASCVVTWLVQHRAGALKGLDVLPLGRRISNAVVSCVLYIAKALWPSRLAAIYPYPAPPPAWAVALGAAAVVAVSVLAVRARARRPWLPVGWFWYLGMLVPVLGLVQVGSQPMADRYTYVPLVGLFIVLAWGAADLAGRDPRRRAVTTAAAVLVVAACAVAARAQVGHWRSSVALWEHALAVTTESHRAENNLGHALARAGRNAEAVAHYGEALRLAPGDAEAHANLGLALADLGRTAEAVGHYEEALRLLPGDVEAHDNLGVALMDQGRIDDAIRHFEEAVRLDPSRALSHNDLGVALARKERFAEAVRELSLALQLDPDYAEARRNLALAHNGLGAALADRGTVDEAVAHYAEALRLQPDLADAHANLARARAGQGRLDEARREAEEAVALEPRAADLHYDLAVLLARQGRTSDAKAQLETVLALDPAHAAARRALAALGPSRR